MKHLEPRTAVLLDHHPVWLGALEPILARNAVEVVGAATDPQAVLALVADRRPDLFIAEISTRDGTAGGLACLKEALERVPDVKVIVLTASAETADIDAAFEAGAAAYIVKTSHPDDIATTIRQAFRHSVFFARTSARTDRSDARPLAVEPGLSAGLTRREVEILRLVAEGYSNSQLAQMLWVTEQTVKFHLSNVYRKLDVRNRTEASRWALLNGVISATKTTSAV